MKTWVSKKFNSQKAIRIAVLLAVDILLLNAAQFIALFLRFELNWSEMLKSGFLHNLIRFAPVYNPMCIIVFALMGIYNSLWEFANSKESVRVVQAAVAACMLQFFLMDMLGLNMNRSFPIMNTMFLSLFLQLSRFSYRILRAARKGWNMNRLRSPTMLIGAGEAGASVLRELSGDVRSRNRIVCIVDDDLHKKGMRLNGVPIVGGRESILENVKRYGVEEIIFAIPSCGASERRAILRICQESGCLTKTLPGLADIANGEVKLESVRKLRIEDLLGRDSVKVDTGAIAEGIRGKTVLVTGGGGSIGSELCRQLADAQPRRLVIFDIYENNAYAIQQELLHYHPELELEVLIGSVRDKARVDMLFEKFRPNIVYHAAAHKHVPLMEDSPNEAVKNNIFGTFNVAAAAEKYKAESFVLISTDKAVNPTNIMGATKRVCEMVVGMFSRRQSDTKFAAVRFGNVLGSNGSVIPLFRSQIKLGGPVTVTHRDIIRYFMTIPEAVSLVMQAGAYARGGEIFVLDMGEPVRIDDLARKMIRLSGLEPDEDIKIVYTGLRPGEKLYEELLMREEGLEKTANNLIYVGRAVEFSEEELMVSLARLERLCAENSPDIAGELAKLVPGYHREAVQP